MTGTRFVPAGEFRSAFSDALRRRAFAVMGMFPVGYYGLSAAGVPVPSTAFRPVTEESLKRSPVLAGCRIFADAAMALIGKAEHDGGSSIGACLR
jgi:uncharacterized glyoxalase superfamily metalloenzyme YdcJ